MLELIKVVARPPGQMPTPFYVYRDHDEFISRRIARRGVWEPFESQVMMRLLSRGDQVIDAGANIGWHSVSTGLGVGEGGRVFSFEPDESNFGVLTKNISLANLSCVRPFQAALGRQSSIGARVGSATNQGDTRIRTAQSDIQPGAKVEIRSLDDVLSTSNDFEIGKLRLFKADIQGFEDEMFRGARWLLANLPARAVLFLEFDPALLAEVSPMSVPGFLDTIYSLQRVVLEIRRPLWRLRRITRAEMERESRAMDLVIAHPSELASLRDALPAISRAMSYKALSSRRSL